MLGSLSEADDALQDAWLRASRAGISEVSNLGGWLTTVVARVCLNMLRSRDHRREEALDAQTADPLISQESGGHGVRIRRPRRPPSSSRLWAAAASCSG